MLAKILGLAMRSSGEAVCWEFSRTILFYCLDVWRRVPGSRHHSCGFGSKLNVNGAAVFRFPLTSNQIVEHKLIVNKWSSANNSVIPWNKAIISFCVWDTEAGKDFPAMFKNARWFTNADADQKNLETFLILQQEGQKWIRFYSIFTLWKGVFWVTNTC